MGRRGPPRTPSAIRRARGTYRKDRGAENEVQPPPGTPRQPKWLDAEARAEWGRLMPGLVKLRIMTESDQAMFADYCAAHSLAVSATQLYQDEGLTQETPQGLLKHPMIKVAQEARAQAMRLGGEFGLSPASRSRVSAPAGGGASEEADKSEDFLFGKPKLVKGD